MKRPNARAAGRSVASVRPGEMGPARPGAAAGSVQPLRGRPAPLPRRTLLLDLPIAWRLAVGFVLGALIAAAAAERRRPAAGGVAQPRVRVLQPAAADQHLPHHGQWPSAA